MLSEKQIQHLLIEASSWLGEARGGEAWSSCCCDVESSSVDGLLRKRVCESSDRVRTGDGEVLV